MKKDKLQNMNNIYQQEARYTLGVKEGGETPHLAIEPFDSDIEFLKNNDAYSFFTLPNGTTLEKAHEIADYINRNVATLAVSGSGNSLPERLWIMFHKW